MEIPEPAAILAALGPIGHWLSETAAELGTLPPLMQGWLVWLAFVTVVWPLLLIRNGPAAIFLALTLPALAMQAAIYWRLGLTRMLALPHLLLWFPALMLLIGHRRAARDAADVGRPPRRMLRLWMAAAAATLSISLVFDVRDALSWLYGADRPYGVRVIDLEPLREAIERLLTPPAAAPEGSGLEAPAAAEGAPAEGAGD